MPRIAVYCNLCRAREIQVYGMVLYKHDDRHQRACYDAGCKHAPYKGNVQEVTPEREAEIDRYLREMLGDDD